MKEDTKNGFEGLEEEILSTFKDGQLISHEWMKSKFGIIPLCWDDYKDVQKLFQAKDKQQFDYMTLVDKLRWDMLKRKKCYLKNIYGDGCLPNGMSLQIVPRFSSSRNHIQHIRVTFR